MILALIAAGAAGGLLGYLLGKDHGYNEGVNDAKALDVQINKLDALLFKSKQPDGSVVVAPPKPTRRP